MPIHRKKGWMCVLVAGFMFFVSVMSQAQTSQTVLRMGSTTGPKHVQTLAEVKFCELVEEYTQGAVRIEHYPSNQLGTVREQLEGVMMGTIDLFGGVAAQHGKFSKDWRIVSVLYWIKDYEHFLKWINSDVFLRMQKKLIEDTGYRFVSIRGMRMPNQFMSKRPVFSMGDLKGLKMRLPPIPGYMKCWEHLGVSPVQIEWGEAYLALRQGVAQCVESSIHGMYAQRFYEVCPYLTETNHILTPEAIVMNDKLFRSLPLSHQEAILKAGQEAGDYFYRISKEGFEDIKQKMLKEGVKWIQIDLTPWQETIAKFARETLEAEGFWETKGLYQQVQDLDKEELDVLKARREKTRKYPCQVEPGKF